MRTATVGHVPHLFRRPRARLEPLEPLPPIGQSGPRERVAPLDRILVPLDGSEFAERILTVVSWILARRDAEVMLLGVLPDDPAWHDDENPIEAAADYLAAQSERLGGERGNVRTGIAVGDAAEKILAFAYDHDPSLIAMATHGRSGLGRWLRGSVTEEVVRSRFPVLTANPIGLDGSERPSPARLRNILVPLDGSDRAGTVLPIVIELARIYDSRVTLLHVVEPIAIAAPTLPFSVGPGTIEMSQREVEGLLAPFEARLSAAGVDVRTRRIAGPPAASILTVAADERSDLLALTTHGFTGLARLVFGSVAEHVLRRAPCPLLVKRSVES